MTKEECIKWLTPQQQIIDGVPQYIAIEGSGYFGTDLKVHFKYTDEKVFLDLSVAEYEAGKRTNWTLGTSYQGWLQAFQDKQRLKNPAIAQCEASSSEGGIFNGIIEGLGAAEIIGGNTVLGNLNPLRIITKNKQNADSFALIIVAIFIYYSIKKYKK